MYQLRTFWDVARTKSLTRSARNLGYSQSSVTAHIRLLETKLGVPLFRRMPHGVRLTGAGEVFHAYVARMFAIMDELSAELKVGGEPSGRVVVGSTTMLMESEMSALVRACRHQHPKVEVSLKVLNAAQAEAAVAAGDVDIAFTLAGTEEAGNSPHVGVLRQTLYPVRFVPVTANALSSVVAGAGGGGCPPVEHVLVVDSDCASQAILPGHLRDVLDQTPRITETGSTRSALMLVREGLGVAMVPRSSLDPDDFVVVRDDLPSAEVYVRAAWSGDVWMAPAVSAFLNLARRVRDSSDQVVR